jgi:3-hydroxyisobutyrate dehydrogenase
VYIDHTTNSPLLVRQVDAALRARGAAMLDAPVSGGMEGARTRDLLVMVGGERAVFERARPVLDAVAARVIYTGAIGNGSVGKLMHNCASFSLDLVMAEYWTAGVKAGVAPETLVDVFMNAALGHMMSLKVRLPATISAVNSMRGSRSGSPTRTWAWPCSSAGPSASQCA